MADGKNRLCPVEKAGSLDNRFRRWLQNPRKILSPYIEEGMTVLDQEALFHGIGSIIKPNGQVLIVEPPFHVSNKAFEKTIIIARGADLTPVERPKVLFSKAVILKKG